MHNDTTQQIDTEHDDVQGFGGTGGVFNIVQPFGGPAGAGGVFNIVQPLVGPSGVGGEFRSIALAGPLLPQAGAPLAPITTLGSKPNMTGGIG